MHVASKASKVVHINQAAINRNLWVNDALHSRPNNDIGPVLYTSIAIPIKTCTFIAICRAFSLPM